MTDTKGKVYVNIEDKSKLCMINSKTLKVEQYWPVAPVDEPSGLAIDTAINRHFKGILFTVSDKHMAVINAQTGEVIFSVPIGDRVDGVAFDRVLRRAYSANGDGTMTVVKVPGYNGENIYMPHGEVLETVKTQKGARTIAVDSKTHHIYLPTAEDNEREYHERGIKSKGPSIKAGTFVVLDIAPVKQ